MKRNLDLIFVTVVIGSFVLVASQRLATVPVYESDESQTLQVSYEMLYRGKLAMPMWRYLAGNIENVWHSYTPVFFVMLTGFLKVFGFGAPQGRVFNLITAVVLLWMIYLIGRRLLNWRAGLVAVVMLISDQTLLERSRLLRNDFAPAMFAALALYFYEKAEAAKSARLFICSGLAAGAGVMCHTNALYMLAAIGLLILLRDGWRAFVSRKLYLFSASALAVMAYEVIYDIIDYKNFALQNREDNLHFGVLSNWGWWHSILDEPRRYIAWYSAQDVYFPNVPLTVLYLFQFAATVAIIYLIVRAARAIKLGRPMDEPRVRLLFVTLFSMLFHAAVVRKAGFYNVHLETWFALCVGILVEDIYKAIMGLRLKKSSKAVLFHKAAIVAAGVAIVAYGYLLARQNYRWLREVRDSDLASFEEVKRVLRDVIPDGVCPVAIKAPIMWLAFPEKDYCFATVEHRMSKAVDIDGKDFALIVRPKSPEHWARELDQAQHLIGELSDTPYGNFLVYYTGYDPRYLALKPRQFYFFRRWRGFATGEQIDDSREVWSADAKYLSRTVKLDNPIIDREGLRVQSARDTPLIELCSIDLNPGTMYQVRVDATSSAAWDLLITDAATGRAVEQMELYGEAQPVQFEAVYRTFNSGSVKVCLSTLNRDSPQPIHVSRVAIREIAPVER